MLQPGQIAPAFELVSQTGEPIRLSDYRGRQNVVLYFYPKDETTGCVKEACAFRDRYEDFLSRQTAVLGVSSDSQASHEKFAARHRLPFPLLVDKGGALRRAYGVGRTLGIIPGRATFVIDQSGIIRSSFSSQFQFEGHIKEALKALAEAPASVKAAGA